MEVEKPKLPKRQQYRNQVPVEDALEKLKPNTKKIVHCHLWCEKCHESNNSHFHRVLKIGDLKFLVVQLLQEYDAMPKSAYVGICVRTPSLAEVPQDGRREGCLGVIYWWLQRTGKLHHDRHPPFHIGTCKGRGTLSS